VAYFILCNEFITNNESSSSMSEQIEHRVIKLELKVEDHAEELKKLQDISTDLRNSLTGIEKTLNQIKYLAMGAVLVVLTQSMGITNVLKMIVGL
jgi:hypothetical protein